jgi:hypothetical protein
VFYGSRPRRARTEKAAVSRLKKSFRRLYPERHDFWLAS